jgi:exodeoxyribonuclease VIII
MARHCMIDLETMSTSHNATILTLGAVIFDPFSNKIFEELYFRIDIDVQAEMGRDVSDDTLDWWSKQDPEIMLEAFSDDDRLPLDEAMDKFHKFVWNCDKVWSHGAVFDIVILEDLLRQMKRIEPWKFWNCRDTRTLFDLADPEMPQTAKHNALEDARRQAIGVQNVYRKLGYRKT